MTASEWARFEGQTIDRTYYLGKLLGSGGFGGVYLSDHRVRDESLRQVAVKLIAPDPDRAKEQFRELVAATTLHHPHLLGCFHAGNATFNGYELLYLVMEVAERSLEDVLKRGPLPPLDALDLTDQLASALAYLHKPNRIHRDLKPANVLLVEGQWKVSDFGTFRQVAGDKDSTRTTVVSGTFNYMPPEAFSGVISIAWDVWSLGVLLHKALAGRVPFTGDTEAELMGAICLGEPAIQADLPAPFGEIVRGCLIKDYKTRWTAVQVHQTVHRFRTEEEARIRMLSKKRAGELKAEGLLKITERQWTAAIAALAQAQELDPDDTGVAEALRQTKQEQQQEQELERHLADLRSQAAQAMDSGDFDRALQSWNELQKLRPDNVEATEGIREVHRKRLERAREGIEQQLRDAVTNRDYAAAASLVAKLNSTEKEPETQSPAVTEGKSEVPKISYAGEDREPIAISYPENPQGRRNPSTEPKKESGGLIALVIVLVLFAMFVIIRSLGGR